MKLKSLIVRPKNRSASLNKILKNDLFFHRSVEIQMALNNERILPRDYLIKKVESKVDTGKQKKIIDIHKNKNKFDYSYEKKIKWNKQFIPNELAQILDENKVKFEIENKKFKELKNDNDIISSFWHYINKKNNQKEREILFKKYFSKDDSHMINLYSDILQQFSDTLFKTNPLLLRKNNSDIFFHYLGEFNKYYHDKEKFLYVKKKILSFLERLNDLLEFVKIKVDNNMDSVSKAIKVQNSRYYKELQMKIDNEIKALKKKEMNINSKDIKESKELIDKTKKTINALFKNKKFFEDPSYFGQKFSETNFKNTSDFIYKYTYNNNNTLKNNLSSPDLIRDNYYSPNKTFKMNSTMSTGFFIPDKSKDLNNSKKNEKLNYSDSKTKHVEFREIKRNESKKNARKSISSSILNGSIKNNAIDNLNESKKANISVLNNHNSIEMEKNSDRDSISSFINHENDFFKKIIITKKNNDSKSKNDEENTSKFLPKIASLKHVYFLKKNSRNSSLSRIRDKYSSKEYDFFLKKRNSSIKAKDKNNSHLYNNYSDINIRNSDKLFKNMNNTLINYKNLQKMNSNESQKPIYMLYENLKDKHKIKEDDLNEINTYLNKTGKKFTKNVKSMDIIRQAKKISDKLDVEKSAKKAFQTYLTFEQIQRLSKIKIVNKKLDKLDADYMNQIFEYKSKGNESSHINPKA